LVEKAAVINFEIQKFVKEHKVVNPLPRVKNNLVIPPLEIATSEYTEEEEDDLATYLVHTFKELQSLEKSDPATFLRDTINFVKQTKSTTGKCK
jgi:hypothetical protein